MSKNAGEYTVKVYDNELKKFVQASSTTSFEETVKSLMIKIQAEKDKKKQSDIQKERLIALNKEPLIFLVTDQVCMETCPEQYYTEGSLSMADGTTVVASISSWNEEELKKKLYNLMYEKVFPTTVEISPEYSFFMNQPKLFFS
jgi:hypothetical protein